MNKEKVLQIIDEIITDRLEQFIEELSTNEFVEQVNDEVYEKLGYDVVENDNEDDVGQLIGSRVIPLLTMVSTYVLKLDTEKE